MNHRLSDIERTLLSAYLDGELSGRELVEAEGLLAASEEAREYLKELRLVESFSSGLLGAPAAGGVMAGSKLSGGAIEAAAERAIYAKAISTGAWGIGGIVSAAAAVVVGIALVVQSPKAPVNRVETAGAGREAAGLVRNAPTAHSMVDLDTSDLMVPPMTPSDLVAFAVHGTLPIDSDRSTFITLACKGENALAVQVHDRAPEDIDDELNTLNMTEVRALDSIQRVIRTSLVRLSQEGIALREDIPSLRLDLIRSLERAAPRMQDQIRTQLCRSRDELNAQNQTYYSTSGGRVRTEGPNGSRQVHYRVISIEDSWNSAIEAFTPPEGEFLFNIAEEPAILIDQSSLRSLQAHMRIPVPSAIEPPAGMEALTPRTAMVSSPAGERVVRKRTQKTATPPNPFDHALRRQMGFIDSSNGEALVPAFGITIHTNDSLVFRAHKSLRRTEEALRRVDSILLNADVQREQRLQTREWERMRKDWKKAWKEWEKMQEDMEREMREDMQELEELKEFWNTQNSQGWGEVRQERNGGTPQDDSGDE